LATLDKSSANTIFNILKLPDLDNKKENDWKWALKLLEQNFFMK
jgi:hypothetical protein